MPLHNLQIMRGNNSREVAAKKEDVTDTSLIYLAITPIGYDDFSSFSPQQTMMIFFASLFAVWASSWWSFSLKKKSTRKKNEEGKN